MAHNNRVVSGETRINIPLKRILLEKYLSQSAAAKAMGLNYEGLSRVVHGWRRPSRSEREKLLLGLGRKKFHQAFPEEKVK